VKRLFPAWVGLLELLEVETVAHHDASKANRLMRIFVSLYKRYSTLGLQQSQQGPTSSLGGSSTGLGHLGSLPPIAAEVCAQALVSLHLYLSSLSPLTSAILGEKAQWDVGASNAAAGGAAGAHGLGGGHAPAGAMGGEHHAQAAQFEWIDRAWNGEKPPMPSLAQAASAAANAPPASPISGSSSSGPSSASSSAAALMSAAELECLTWELCGPPELRVALLKELYPRLAPFSFVKARVAYTIGHYTCTAGVHAAATLASMAAAPAEQQRAGSTSLSSSTTAQAQAQGQAHSAPAPPALDRHASVAMANVAGGSSALSGTLSAAAAQHLTAESAILRPVTRWTANGMR